MEWQPISNKKRINCAILTHCYGHALDLAVSDTLKKSTLCRDAMDVGFEIAKLIRFSPKRSAALERIKDEDVSHGD